MKQYRFTWECPRCDRLGETTGIGPTRVHCGDCLMDRTEVVLMQIKNVEPLPEEPMVNLKIVGPDGEPIENEWPGDVQPGRNSGRDIVGEKK